MTSTDQLSQSDVYRRFLAALNAGDHSTIAEVIAPDFTDHHPGFEIKGLDSYQQALREAKESLRLEGELEEILEIGDRLVTRVRLTGKHLGTALGFPATGRDVAWSTTEIWRVSGGLLAERWAQDDLLGLREQLSGDAANVELVQKVSDAVNERRYDDLDDLFAADFVDRNPAWSVESLDELKGIIKAAHDALDFTVSMDDMYAADDDKVVTIITFTGRHVAPFFGQEPTGKTVTWTSIEVYRIENGKVAERWVQADTTGLMYQTGVPLPE